MWQRRWHNIHKRQKKDRMEFLFYGLQSIWLSMSAPNCFLMGNDILTSLPHPTKHWARKKFESQNINTSFSTIWNLLRITISSSISLKNVNNPVRAIPVGHFRLDKSCFNQAMLFSFPIASSGLQFYNFTVWFHDLQFYFIIEGQGWCSRDERKYKD